MLDSRCLSYVLVVGCQRTGTNLTGLILGLHPHSVLIEEGDGSYKCLRVESSAEASLLAALSKARHKYRAPRRRFVRGSPLGLRCKVAPSVSHLILQVPNSTYDCEALAGRLRNLHFVFPTRDVRDVVCSMADLSHIPMVRNQLRFMKEHPHIAKAFAAEIAQLEDERTSIHVRRALVWRVKTSLLFPLIDGPFNVIQVRYEDLVNSPGSTGKRLMDAVGFPALDEEVTRNSLSQVYRGVGMGGTDRAGRIRQKSIGRWRDQLSASEESEIWEVAGHLMERLGYERSGVPE